MNSEQRNVYIRRIVSVAAFIGIFWPLMGSFSQISGKTGILVLLIVFPLAVMTFKKLRGYTFTAWVLTCAGVAMLFPQFFTQWGEFKLELLIIPLTQIIMFGMGTTLSIHDFIRVTKSPLPVFMGIFLQFSIMPIFGYVLAVSFGFDGELAAGIVLIGSCSGGVASNLMVYLARGNVALSVTMTSVSTLLAPLATSLLMSNLAGAFVPIDVVQMMLSILNMIIVPVVAGLIAHDILYGNRSWMQKGINQILLTIGLIFFAMTVMFLGHKVLGPLYSGLAMGGVLIAGITLTKFVIGTLLGRPNTWMNISGSMLANYWAQKSTGEVEFTVKADQSRVIS